MGTIQNFALEIYNVRDSNTFQNSLIQRYMTRLFHFEISFLS